METRTILGSDGRPTSASTFLVVHQALSRDLERFPVAARSLAQAPDGARVDAFREHWKNYRDILDAHHELEDKILFPELWELAPGLGDLLELLGTKHADLEALLDTASMWVEQLPEEVDQAVAAFEELAEFLEFHLATEEAHLVPVMLSSLEAPAPPEVTEPTDPSEASPPEPDDGDLSGHSPTEESQATETGSVETTGGVVGFDFGPVAPSFALPWCTDGLDDGVTQVLLAVLPQPMQAEYPLWREAYQQTLALWG